MRKTILMALLAVVSGNTAADWVEVSSNAGQTIYASLNSRRKVVDIETKNENIVSMWTLIDYTAAQKSSTNTFLSAKVRVDFDCAEGKSRTAFYSSYAENMAQSNPLNINISPADWGTILTDDVNETMWKIACESAPTASPAPPPDAQLASAPQQPSLERPASSPSAQTLAAP